MSKEILFYFGFLLIILLVSGELNRAGRWVRAYVRQYPERRVIVYPLVVALAAAAGLIILNSLLYFVTEITFSYE